MFREVSRDKRQILSEGRSIAILEKASSGVLALVGDEGYTYGVPMNYCYSDGKLYFHAMKKGHKMDAIKKHNKVSFTVIETDRIVPEEFTSYFRSVIVFGEIRTEDDVNKKKEALAKLVEKYSPEFMEKGEAEINSQIDAVQILVLDVKHVSGKEAIELAV